MDMMLDKRQIWVIFLFSFKMSSQSVSTIPIDNAFSTGSASKRTMWLLVVQEVLQRWWQPWRWGVSAQPWEVDNDQSRAITEAGLITACNVARVQCGLQQFFLQTQWCKSFISGCHGKWKLKSFWTTLLLFCAITMKCFLIELRCAIKSGLYEVTSDDQLRNWTSEELLSNSQNLTRTQKFMVPILISEDVVGLSYNDL